MNDHHAYDDPYDDYAADFDPMQVDRRARRRRKPKARHTPKRSAAEIIETLADETEGLEGGFQTTYQPAQHEAVWLYDSLRTFYDQALITDVLAVVKGGKEASVYRCAAHPSTGETLLAAKVYRPRMFRNLRNDARYKQGRDILSAEGHQVKQNERRIMKAVGKKSAFGESIAHTSWLMHEFTTLQHLHALGASVPRAVMAGNNAILMQYLGDERQAAPTLNRVTLTPDEAQRLFEATLRNIALLLGEGLVHGDLSAYNILYWEGTIKLIDFPQVVYAPENDDAYAILARDVQRVCEYFAGQGVACDSQAETNRLWAGVVGDQYENRAADFSRAALPEDDDAD
ncbi:MAG: RIO1 family regulatory kinase/ATPase [Anaerolineales bacterium]